MEPVAQNPKDFTENTLFWINHEFAIIKNAKVQRRGKVFDVFYILWNLKVNSGFNFNR